MLSSYRHVTFTTTSIVAWHPRPTVLAPPLGHVTRPPLSVDVSDEARGSRTAAPAPPTITHHAPCTAVAQVTTPHGAPAVEHRHSSGASGRLPTPARRPARHADRPVRWSSLPPLQRYWTAAPPGGYGTCSTPQSAAACRAQGECGRFTGSNYIRASKRT